MSNNIDQRIVEMQFDNQQFEKNVQTSVKSLEELKAGLDLDKAAKGLSELDKAGKTFSLAGIAEGIESLSNRFSNLGIIGMTALQNITNTAMNAGKEMLKSLTITPVKTGFAEYETQMGATQTILANTGAPLEEVNKQLNELNTYADQTIYNFTEMTKNIGRFTAAGVGLETSTKAIKGIANLAAVSGSTSEQASMAMYQLSQALSAGTVKYQDWISVRNAGMGGAKFKNALIDYARATQVAVEKTEYYVDKSGKRQKRTVRKNIDQLIADAGSFEETLKEGWLTSDILTTVLDHFAIDVEAIAEAEGISIEAARAIARDRIMKGTEYTEEEANAILKQAEEAKSAAQDVKTFTQLIDTLRESAQSGWTQTWQYIVGDFEEAKKLLTKISDRFGGIIQASADSRNAVMKDWKEASGPKFLFDGLANIVDAIQHIVGVFKGAFEEFFPPTTGQQLADMTERFKDFTHKIKAFFENTEISDKLKRIFRGVAAALDIVRTVIGFVWEGFKKLIGVTDLGSGSILEFVASIGDFIVGIRDSIKNSETFQSIIEKVGTAFAAVKDFVVSVGKAIGKVFGKIWTWIKSSGLLNKVWGKITDFINGIPEAVKGIKTWCKSVVEYVKKNELFKKAWDKIKNFFGPAIEKIKDFIARFKEAIKSFFSADTSGKESLGDKLKARFAAFRASLSSWFASVKEKAKDIWEKVKSFFTTLFTKTIPEFFQKITSKLGTTLEKIKGIDIVDILKKALGIYAGFKIVSFIGSFSKIGKGMKKIGSGLGNIGDGLKKGLKEIGKGIKNRNNRDTLGNTMLKIAASIGIMVGAIYLLSKMNNNDVMKGLGLLTILGVELLALSLIMSKISLDGTALLKAVAAVVLMVIPIKMLASMKTEDAIKGLIGLGLLFIELGAFTRLADKKFTGKNMGLIGMAVAINLLVRAVKNLGKMDIGQGIKGIIGIGAIFAIMAKTTGKMGSQVKLKGLISMALAVNLLAFAVKNMGSMKTSVLIKGVAGISAMMAAFGFLAKSSAGNSLKKTGVMMVALVGTLLIFTEAFKMVDGFNANNMVGFAASVSAIIVSVAASVKLLENVRPMAALKAIGSLDIAILGLGALIVGLGALNKLWPEMKGFLADGGDIMGQIGTAFGKFIGGIGGGIVEGLNLPGAGQSLTDFMTNSAGFFEGVKAIDQSVVDGVGFLTTALGLITGQQFMASLAGIFSGEDPVSKFSGQLVELGGALAGFGTEIIPLASVPQTAINNAVRIMAAFGGLSGLLTGNANYDEFVTKATTVCGALIDFSTKATELTSEKYDESKIDSVIGIATKLAELEKSLQGHGGLSEAVDGIKDLSVFGKSIDGEGDFANGLNSFILEAKKLKFDYRQDKANIDAIIAIAQSLATLETSLEAQGGDQDNWEGVKSLTLFGKHIYDSNGKIGFADALKGFIDGVRQIEYTDSDEKKMGRVLDVATALNTLENNLQGQGGMSDAWNGIQSLAKFSGSFEDFTANLNKFITGISGIKDKDFKQEKIDAAIGVAEALNRLENNLAGKDGWWQSVIGQKDLGQFARNVRQLGSALASFANDMNGVKPSDGDVAVDTITPIRTFVESLDGEGGLLSLLDKLINGDKWATLNTYTSSIADMGTNLATFATGIRSVKADDAQLAVKRMGELKKFVEDVGDIGSINDNAGKISSFASNMGSFGNGFKAFSTGISKATAAEADFEKTKTILGLFRTLYAESTTWGEFDNSSNLMKLMGVVHEFAFEVGAFYEKMGDTDAGKYLTAAETLKTITEAAVAATQLGDDDTSLSKIQELLDGFASLVVPDFTDEGLFDAVEYVGSFVSGLQNGYESLEGAIKQFSNVGVREMYNCQDDWVWTGKNLAIGLANGITRMASAVRNAALNVASGAVRTIQMTWAVHSPSRVGRDLGMYFDLGIAGGLDDYAKVVDQSANGVGQTAVDTAKNLLGSYTTGLTDGMDATPTIRPVIDLSDVNNGVNTINGLFNANKSLSAGIFSGSAFNRNASNLTFDGARIVGSDNNKSVVNAIDSLTDRFNNLSEAVAGMKLVLDTGTLVGEIDTKMDKRLGMLAGRRERGN